jgi:glycosyltransferase involved in cell wall biosynthesis
MKVLKIIHTLGHGGAENTFRWLAWGLQQKGVEVISAIPSVSNSDRENWITLALEHAGVPVVTFDKTGSPWQMMKNLADVIDQVQPDLVHSHLLDSNFYSSLVCWYKAVPHVCTEHGDVSLRKTIVKRVKYAVISKLSKCVICVSNAVRVNAMELIPARRKLVVIYNGIRFMEQMASSFRTELGIPDNAVLIGNVGNLYPIKGQKFLLSAFAEICEFFPLAILVFVGRGGEEEALRNLEGILNIPPGRVMFAGFRNDIENVMNAFDLYVQPSLSEGHPLAVLEAMSLGLPVIATAVGGVPEIIKSDEFGTLVNPGRVDELRASIEDFLNNPRGCKKMAAAGQSFVREEFSVEQMVERYLNCYDNALS